MSASGIKIDDATVTVFNGMKVNNGPNDPKHKELLVMEIRGKPETVVEVPEFSQRICDNDKMRAFLEQEHFKPDSDKRRCFFIIHDFQDPVSKQKKLYGFFWMLSDETAIRDKMIYAATYQYLRQTINIAWATNTKSLLEELTDEVIAKELIKKY